MKTATFVLSAAVAMAGVGNASAQETNAAPPLTLELNGAQPSEKGCRLTFVVTNDLGGGLSKAAFEIALFNDGGVVDRLTVLDFKDLPAGKTKVTRFDLPGLDCARIGRVLVNSATECVGDGISPAACLGQLKTQTKTTISFGQ
jgi:hypothetical protein